MNIEPVGENRTCVPGPSAADVPLTPLQIVMAKASATDADDIGSNDDDLRKVVSKNRRKNYVQGVGNSIIGNLRAAPRKT